MIDRLKAPKVGKFYNSMEVSSVGLGACLVVSDRRE